MSVSTTLTSTIGDDIGKDVSATELSSEGDEDAVIPKREKLEVKRQTEKGKIQKKRFIADLIATAPPNQIKWDAGNYNCASEKTSSKVKLSIQRSKAIRSQRCSKDSIPSLKNFKGKRKYRSELPSISVHTYMASEKSHPESLEMRRKRQRLGISAQSSALKFFKEVSRRENERELVANSSERSQADHLSLASRRKMYIQELILDKTKAQAQLEGDDVLMDVAGFMAQNQLERHATITSPRILQENECFKCFEVVEKFPKRDNPKHVVSKSLEQLRDQFHKQSNSSSRQGLVREQDAFRCVPHEVVSEDGQIYLVVERGHQQISQVNNSLIPDKLDVSGQAKRAGTISKTKDRMVSSDYLDIITRTSEKNMGHRGKFVVSGAKKLKKNEGSSTSERKKSKAHNSFKKSKPSSKHALARYRVAFRCNNNDVISKVGECQQINQLHKSLLQEKPGVSRQGKEAWIEKIVSGSRDWSDARKRNSQKKMGHRGKLVSSVAMTGRKERGPHKKRKSGYNSIEGSDSSSKKDLIGGEDSFRCVLAEVAEQEGQVYLVAEEDQQTNAGQMSFVPDELGMPGQANRAGTVFQTGAGIVSHSNCLDLITKTGERHVSHRGKLANSVARKGQKNKVYATSQRKKSATCRSLKESNSASKQGISTEQDAFRCIPDEAISDSVHVYLVADDGHQQTNQVQESDTPRKQDVLGQAEEAREIPEMKDGLISGSRDAENKLGHRGNLVNSVASKGQKDRGPSASHHKKSTGQKSIKEPRSSVKKSLVREQDTSMLIPAETVSDDDQVELVGGNQQVNPVQKSLVSEKQGVLSEDDQVELVGGNQQVNHVQESLVSEKQGVSGGSTEGGTFFEMRDGIVSGSRDHSDIMENTCDGNLGFRGNLVSSIAIKGQEDRGSSTRRKKKSAAHKSIKVSNSSSKQALVRKQDGFRGIPTEVVSEDNQVNLVARRNEHMNEEKASPLPKKLAISGQAQETGMISEARDRIDSESRGSLEIVKRTGEENLDHTDKFTSSVVTNGHKDRESSTSQKKKSAGHKSIKELKALAKASHSRTSIIEETNAALNAALSNIKRSRPAFADTAIRSSNSCSDQSFHSNIGRSIDLESIPTVAGGSFASVQNLVQTVEPTTFRHREQLLVDNCCTQLTLNSQGLQANSNRANDKNLESKNLCQKDKDLHPRLESSISTTPTVVPTVVYNPQIGALQPTLRKEDKFEKPTAQLVDRNFSVKNGCEDAEKVEKDQASVKDGSSWAQLPVYTNVSIPSGFPIQSSSSATCLPTKNFVGPNRTPVATNSDSSNSFGCILPYVTLPAPPVKSTSDGAHSSNHSWPLIPSHTFTFAQGHERDIPTSFSQKTICHSNSDLLSYMKERIEACQSSWGSEAKGHKRSASAVGEEDARKRSKPNTTSARNIGSSTSQGNLKVDLMSLGVGLLNRNPAESMKGNCKIPSQHCIQKRPYRDNLHINTEEFSIANQALQAVTLSLAQSDAPDKTKDLAFKQTVKSKFLTPIHARDTEGLRADLSAHALKNQKFGKKLARMDMNARHTFEAGAQVTDALKQRTTCSAGAALTSETFTSSTFTAMEALKLSAGFKHILNPPAQNQHCLPIHSTHPFIHAPMGKQNFQGELKAYTDPHHKFAAPLEKPFKMQEGTFHNSSHRTNTLFGSAAGTYIPEIVGGTEYAKMYSSPDMMGFLRPTERDKTWVYTEKIIGENSAARDDKETSTLKNLCKDAQLELSLSLKPGISEDKQEAETVGNLKALSNNQPWKALAV
eukprot:Gb_29935 [translate_table: standard]